jgi:transcriptional regulator with XRE-family HTH domain
MLSGAHEHESAPEMADIAETRPSKTLATFGARLLERRKAKDWSQGDLAQRIDTSAPIIGRYERGDMSPSIDVAAKIARALGVSLDYLLGVHDLPDLLADQAMLARWQALDALPAAEQRRILDTMDALLRDAQTRRAYAPAG